MIVIVIIIVTIIMGFLDFYYPLLIIANILIRIFLFFYFKFGVAILDGTNVS